MRKIHFIFSVFFFYTLSVHGQRSQLKIANNSLGKLHVNIKEKADVKKQLTVIGEGLKAIEIAEKDKKTGKYPETWAIKAYLSSHVALLDANTANADKYYQLAKDAYAKALKLDRFETNGDLLNAANHNLHAKMQLYGITAFERNDFAAAFDLLKDVSDFKPTDTTLATNVAICAQNLQRHNEALHYFLRAISNGSKDPAIFQQVADLYAAKFETELAIKTLEDGLAINPMHNFLMHDYINLLLDNEQYHKASKAVESSLVKEKRNKLLYFLYGYLQQNEHANLSTAKLAYEKALDIDYNYFDALYQLALVYVQQANDALKKQDNKSYSAQINRAEYALMKAHEININDRNTVKLLIDIYTRKNRLDKVQTLKRKLNEF